MKYLILPMLILSGCMTVPKYNKAGEGGFKVGYSEIKLTPNSFRIRYIDTDSSQCYMNFLRRASELTLGNNFKYFTVSDATNGRDSNAQAHMGYGFIADWSLPQYEATVLLVNVKSTNTMDPNEILSANPLPAKAAKKL